VPRSRMRPVEARGGFFGMPRILPGDHNHLSCGIGYF